MLIISSVAHANVTYVETQARGSGETFEIALKKALVQALSKINGVTIQSQSALETIEKTISSNEGNSASLTRNLNSTINEKTNGSIKSFEILNETKDANGIVNVEVRAQLQNLISQVLRKEKELLLFHLDLMKIG